MRTAVWTDSVSVLDRVTAVLEAFGDDDSLGVSEIARRANLPKSTVSRLATSLVEQRYLDRDGDRLHLGLRLFELGQAVERPRRMRRLSHPVLTELRNHTGESISLVVLDGDHIVVIAAVGGRDGAGRPVGSRAPASSTAPGMAILAHLRHVGPIGASLARDFAEIRRTGIATGSGGSTGTACVASPVLGPGSAPLAAIALSGSPAAVDARRVGGLVRSAAADLARRFTATR
jgi:IclR family acetate operon transcriptional repressor